MDTNTTTMMIRSRAAVSSQGNGNIKLPLIYDNMRAQAPTVRRCTKLPKTFTPSNYDVICGKGKSCFDHIGNRRFRITVDIHLPKYVQARSRAEKSSIVAKIVDTVRETGAVGFIKTDPETGDWYDVGDHASREKVSQTIRDMLKQRNPERRALRNLRRKEARRVRSNKHSPQTTSIKSVDSPTSSTFDISHTHSVESTSSSAVSYEPITVESSWSCQEDGNSSESTTGDEECMFHNLIKGITQSEEEQLFSKESEKTLSKSWFLSITPPQQQAKRSTPPPIPDWWFLPPVQSSNKLCIEL